jgi:type II secretory pathway pseudopilin PulG
MAGGLLLVTLPRLVRSKDRLQVERVAVNAAG